MPRKNKILWVWREEDEHADEVVVATTQPRWKGDFWLSAGKEMAGCTREMIRALGFTPTETPERIRLSVERLDR